MISATRASRLVGILGGMGPSATADFYTKLIESTPAEVDQEHLRVVIWADPTVPSRQEALLAGGTDPTPWLEAGVEQLQRCGAEIVVVPCNTVHGYLPRVMGRRPIEFISIIDVTINAIQQHNPTDVIGLLATDGALASGIYQKALLDAGYQVAIPHHDEQAQLTRIIHGVKAGQSPTGLNEELRPVIASLEYQGAGVAIIGCTELSTLLKNAANSGSLQIIDPAIELARATVSSALDPSVVDGCRR